MASKQLEAILAALPPATASKKEMTPESQENSKMIRETSKTMVKIVATANQEIKDELKKVARRERATETIIILKALKQFGFKSIDDSMLVDKRTLR